MDSTARRPAPPTGQPPASPRRWLQPLVWAVVLAALALTFTAYLSPHLARDLADWAWACFG